MADISRRALSKISKVSLNFNKDFIDLAEKIGKLTGQNKTMVFSAWIGKGVDPLFQDMETTWKGLLTAGNLNQDKKKKVEKLLKGIKKIRKDWNKTLNQMI